jgi:hypothetical protein
MHFEEHCKASRNKYGASGEMIHNYLDQYFKYFRNEAHRLILHHEKGAHKIGHKFAEFYGYDKAYKIACQHIEDDLGYLPVDYLELAPHMLFLNCREVMDARQFLLTEFPLDDFSKLEYKINY